MELAQLRHLVALADHGSIGRAARALHMSQPGLTKSLRRLEESAGTKLLERHPRGVALTPQGRRLVEHARLIRLQVADARRELDLAWGDEASLAIGAGPAWFARYLPTAVGRVLSELPGLRVRLVGGFNDRLFQALVRGELDLVVAAIPEGGAMPNLRIEPLTHDDLQVIAPAFHPFVGRRDVTPALLQAAEWVLPGREVASRVRLDALFLAHALAPPVPRIESDSISFIMATLREGNFLSFATRQSLSAPEAAGLVSLELEAFSIRRDAGLVFRERAVPSHAALRVAHHLRQICDELHSEN